jgi:hypothetical protein
MKYSLANFTMCVTLLCERTRNCIIQKAKLLTMQLQCNPNANKNERIQNYNPCFPICVTLPCERTLRHLLNHYSNASLEQQNETVYDSTPSKIWNSLAVSSRKKLFMSTYVHQRIRQGNVNIVVSKAQSMTAVCHRLVQHLAKSLSLEHF